MTGTPHAAVPVDASATAVHSPNSGPVNERQALHRRFESRLGVNQALTRKAVSYQGNRDMPGFRWLKYKEGFSRGLVERLIDDFHPDSLLDPFAGIGTAPLIAAGRGLRATGIEIMPVGVLAGKSIAHAANGFDRNAAKTDAASMIKHVKSNRRASGEHSFPHVRITEAAFPKETEKEIARAREYLAGVDDDGIRNVLNFACMSVLESASYTRKDGQYLRWDYRSGRKLRARVHKGEILPFQDALEARLREIEDDVDPLRKRYGRGAPTLLTGSSLSLLRKLADGAFDVVVTSPPYANRYDYTRTYALELAWLGYGQDEFRQLRQQMLSATVENKSKRDWLRKVYGDSGTLDAALQMYENQGALHEVIEILNRHLSELSNPQVIRLIQGYFLEMAVIVAELGRIVRPGGSVFMVNDNVQYHGEEVPVDLILSDFAEQSGFRCERIWTLPRGKGNSSQQMGRFGRRELRKCVYHWARRDDASGNGAMTDGRGAGSRRMSTGVDMMSRSNATKGSA